MKLSERMDKEPLSEKLIFLSWEDADWFEVMQQLGKEANQLEKENTALKQGMRLLAEKSDAHGYIGVRAEINTLLAETQKKAGADG